MSAADRQQSRIAALRRGRELSSDRKASHREMEKLLEELAGLVRPDVMSQRAAHVLRQRLHLPLVSFALLDKERGEYAMQETPGARTREFSGIRLRPGQGLGGRAVAERGIVSVADYQTDPRITDHFRGIVAAEGLRGATAVPVLHAGRPIGIVYGARRTLGRPDDRRLDALDVAAKAIAPLLATAVAAHDHTALRVGEERQRIASELHDDVAQLLFSITATARQARTVGREHEPELTRLIGRIEEQAQRAAARLRDTLHAMSPATPSETLPVAAQWDVDEFTDRSGIPACLILRGNPATGSPARQRVVLTCLRHALFNIEQHALARLVIVTLNYQPGALSLVVQDDGQGVPSEMQPPALPDGGVHWGLTSMTRQVEQLGGHLHLERPEEGGTRLRIRLPLSAASAGGPLPCIP